MRLAELIAFDVPKSGSIVSSFRDKSNLDDRASGEANRETGLVRPRQHGECSRGGSSLQGRARACDLEACHVKAMSSVAAHPAENFRGINRDEDSVRAQGGWGSCPREVGFPLTQQATATRSSKAV